MGAAVAMQSDGGLVMWRQGVQELGDHQPIVGTRLDVEGMPTAEGLVAPASPASRQEVNAVASSGQNFFVSWLDTRDPLGQGRALLGARIGIDAKPLDPQPMQITAEPVEAAEVVFDGSNFVATWVRRVAVAPESAPFNTVRVSPDGERLDEEPLHPPLCGRYIGAASDGTRTLLVGNECGGDDLRAVLLNDEGGVDDDILLFSSDGYRPVVVSSTGVDYLVVWLHSEPDPEAEGDGPAGLLELLGQRVTSAGTLVGQPFPITSDFEFHSHMDIAAGGGVHLVVWRDSEAVRAKWVTADGQVLESDAEHFWAPMFDDAYPSAAFDGENFVMAWRARSVEEDPNSIDLHGAVVSPQGELLSQWKLSEEPEREGRVVLAGGDGGVLAAFDRFLPGPPYDARRALVQWLP
jgi:hypothetical protein